MTRTHIGLLVAAAGATWFIFPRDDLATWVNLTVGGLMLFVGGISVGYDLALNRVERMMNDYFGSQQ